MTPDSVKNKKKEIADLLLFMLVGISAFPGVIGLVLFTVYGTAVRNVEIQVFLYEEISEFIKGQTVAGIGSVNGYGAVVQVK